MGGEPRYRQAAAHAARGDGDQLGKALFDLARLHEFHHLKNLSTPAKAVQAIVGAPEVLLAHPRLGERIEEFAPRELRRLLVLNYEMRYEIQHDIIYLRRIWHTREDR